MLRSLFGCSVLLLATTLALGAPQKLSDVFSCPPLAAHTPATDVRSLRADDISVVMAFGDSITAGYAMSGNTILAKGEFRGQSATIGGDDDAVTLPNMLKRFNPKLVGGAKGQTMIGCQCHGKPTFPHAPQPSSTTNTTTATATSSSSSSSPTATPAAAASLFSPIPWFPSQCTEEMCGGNGAISGATVLPMDLIMPNGTLSLAPKQLLNLITNKTTFPTIDFENDWKLMTIFVGSIDALMACNLEPANATAQFKEAYSTTLQALHDLFPRTMVQIISESELIRSVFAASASRHCLSKYEQLGRVLKCCTYPGNGTNCAAVERLAMDWNDVLEDLATEWEAKQLPGFRVVVNPAIKRNVVLGDETSLFDCFHPNQVANQHFAVNMWNNLFLPQEEKRVSIDRNAVPYCPTIKDYLQ